MSKGTATKDRLVETATELFLGRGFGAVGTQEICRRAQVNKGTLYHFFPSKTDLALAAIMAYAERVGADIEVIAGSDAPPIARLARLFALSHAANSAWKAEHGVTCGCLVGNSALELATLDDRVRRALATVLDDWARAAQPIVAALIANGDVPGIDPALGARALMAYHQGLALMAKTHDDPSLIETLAPGGLGLLRTLPTAPPG